MGGYSGSPTSSILVTSAFFVRSEVVDMPVPEVKISWKVVAVLSEEPPIHRDSLQFKLSQNVGLYSQFDIALDFCYVPLLLRPNRQFYQKINGLLRSKLDIHIKDYRFPYKIFIPRIGTEVLLNISKVRLFLPNVLSLTVDISNLPPTLDAEELIDYQYLHQLEPINSIVQWTIGMAEKLTSKNLKLTQSYHARPAIRIDGISSSDQLKEHFNENISRYVGILIRNPDYAQMSDAIAKRIWEKNRYLAEKTSRKLLLINKQGVLYLTASIPEDQQLRSQPPDFSRTCDLYEVALVFDALLKNYISLRLQNEDLADSILYKIHPWLDTPEVIFSSFSYRNVWELLVDEFKLNSRVQYIVNKVDFNRERQLREEYSRLVSADKNPEAESFFLDIENEIHSSVIEQKIKEVALDDLEQAKIAYNQGAFKACAIMLGAVLEGLMLGTIRRSDVLNNLRNDLNCPRAIKRLGLKDPSLADKISGELRFEDYKNIIHHLMPDIERLKIEGIQTFRNAVHPWKAIQEPNIYRTFDQSRAMLHITSLRILTHCILSWSP